jgi:pimeloyl-ACP methyl ester carboxylesterase
MNVHSFNNTGKGSMQSTPTPPAWLDRVAYPFTSRWLTLSSGTRLHYIDAGTGPVVLFVHGTPTWSFEWRHQIRALSPHFRTVAVDLVGMGLSDRPTDFAYTPEAHSTALNEFVETLELRDVTLVVHDFGGPIALPLAVRDASRVARVVIINTFAWSLDDDAGIRRPARLFGSAFGRWLYRRFNFSLRVIVPAAFANKRALTPEIHRQYLAPFPDAESRGLVLHAFARALLGSSDFYRRIADRLHTLRNRPALIIWGTGDPAFRTNQLERWMSVLPHARVVRLQTGHWPQEEMPDAVSDALHTFLDDSRLADDGDTTHTPRPIDTHSPV